MFYLVFFGDILFHFPFFVFFQSLRFLCSFCGVCVCVHALMFMFFLLCFGLERFRVMWARTAPQQSNPSFALLFVVMASQK